MSAPATLPLARALSGALSGDLAADSRSLDALKRDATRDPQGAIRSAARQFEALFMQMVLKSMREAMPKSGLLESSAGEMYTGMLDQQLADRLARERGGRLGGGLVKGGEVHFEIAPDHLGGDRHIHRAEQWQPMVGGIAEGGDFPLRVHHRLVGAGINGAAGAKAGGDDPRFGISGANGAHHVVAAAGAD